MFVDDRFVAVALRLTPPATIDDVSSFVCCLRVVFGLVFSSFGQFVKSLMALFVVWFWILLATISSSSWVTSSFLIVFNSSFLLIDKLSFLVNVDVSFPYFIV